MKRMKHIDIPGDNRTLSVPPKCGSSSVYASLSKHFGVDELVNCHEVRLLKAHLVAPESKILFVVREPLDRFKSLWRNKCRDGGKVAGTMVVDRLRGLTPEELLDFIEEYGNHHWELQSNILASLNHVDEITMIPTERLSTWWAQNTDYPPLEQLNSTTGNVYLSGDLEAKVLEHYKRDVHLYDAAWRPE